MRRGRRGLRPSRVAEGGHRGLVAEDIVGVTNGIGSSTFVGLVAAKVVLVNSGVAEWIGDGGKISELVVGVGGAIAERIDGSGTLAEGVVFDVTRVATTVDVSDLAAKRIVGNGVGDSGDRDIHQRDTVTRERQRFVGRVGKRLARGDERGINQRLVFGHVAANVSCARARR